MYMPARISRVAIVAIAACYIGFKAEGRLSLVAAAYAQVVVPLLPGEEVPPGFASQSIFLICNPEWILAEREADLSSLHASFEAFGRAIGDDNAAVWFWRIQPDMEDGLADDVDIERSAQICGQLGLLPSASPHIVLASKWDRDHFIISLGGLDAEGIKKVLTSLTDRVVVEGIGDESIQVSGVLGKGARFIRKLLFAPVGSLARAITVSIDTRFFKIEMDGSKLVQ